MGEGGHAAAILESSSPSGMVFGIDLDPRSLAYARRRLSRYGQRFDCVQGNYADMLSLAQAHGVARVDGLIMDLGFSARQVQQPGYGFSFRLDEPLDMRFDPASPLTAEHVVNTFSERDLAQLIFRYGQEPRSRAVARAMVSAAGPSAPRAGWPNWSPPPWGPNGAAGCIQPHAPFKPCVLL